MLGCISRLFVRSWFVALITMQPILASSDEVRLAVASNFTPTMKKIESAFEQGHPHTLLISYGSSGKLFAQIQHGAPFDVFLSADQDKPKRLEKLGLSIARSRRTYAIGSLVVWSPSIKHNELRQRLISGEYDRLALANPMLAPYGRAAVEVLQSLGIQHSSRNEWVMGENIAQAFQFVHSGNAQLGMVAHSQLIGMNVFDDAIWFIPSDFYAPIKQDLIVLKRASANQGVNCLLSFLQNDKIVSMLKDYGYTVPLKDN